MEKNIPPHNDSNEAPPLQQKATVNPATIGPVRTSRSFIELSQEIYSQMQQDNPIGQAGLFYKPVPQLIDHSIKDA